MSGIRGKAFGGICAGSGRHGYESSQRGLFRIYLNDVNLDDRQIYFVNQIVEYIVQNGLMKDSPCCKSHLLPIWKHFPGV